MGCNCEINFQGEIVGLKIISITCAKILEITQKLSFVVIKARILNIWLKVQIKGELFQFN